MGEQIQMFWTVIVFVRNLNHLRYCILTCIFFHQTFISEPTKHDRDCQGLQNFAYFDLPILSPTVIVFIVYYTFQKQSVIFTVWKGFYLDVFSKLYSRYIKCIYIYQ